MKAILEFIKNEPVIVKAIVTLAVALAATFGFDVDSTQLVAILTVLGVVTVPTVRAKVTPTRNV